MKINIELSESLHKEVLIAAKNLKMSKKKFIVKAIRKMTMDHQRPGSEITASLNKFFKDHPGIDVSWWNDKSWDDCQPKR